MDVRSVAVEDSIAATTLEQFGTADRILLALSTCLGHGDERVAFPIECGWRYSVCWLEFEV